MYRVRVGTREGEVVGSGGVTTRLGTAEVEHEGVPGFVAFGSWMLHLLHQLFPFKTQQMSLYVCSKCNEPEEGGCGLGGWRHDDDAAAAVKNAVRITFNFKSSARQVQWSR